MRILIPLILIFLLLLIKILTRYDCEKVLIENFKKKERYCVMYSDKGILIAKKCYYGEWVVCGERNGNITFVGLVFNPR